MYGGESVRKYITAAEAAKIFGLNRHYAARLAQRSNKNGQKWPVKQGRTWIAPISEWEKIFNPKGVHIRKKRKKEMLVKENKSKETLLISASEAGRQLGYSKSWASVLAKRSRKKGSQWPQKVGNMWLAPLNEWENIFQKKEK